MNAPAIAFLERAFAGHTGYVSVSAIDPTLPNEAEQKILTRAVHISDIATLAGFIEQWNGKRNLYWSVNPSRSAKNKKATKQDIEALAYLHVDLDPQDGKPIVDERERIKKELDSFSPPPNVVIDSGGGYGAFWRLRKPVHVNGNIAELESYNARLMLALGGDHCQNIDRIMRLPGTTNLPDAKKRAKGRDVYEAALVHFDEGAYELTDFEGLPVTPPKGETPPLNAAIPLRVSALAERLPKLKKRLMGDTSGLNDKSRSGLDYAVTSLLVRERCFDDEIAATLKGYGHGKALEQGDAYIRAMLVKLRAEAGQTPDSAPFKPSIINAASLRTIELGELHWVIPQMLPEGLAVLAGRPKQGKSRIALNIAAALASGGHVLGSQQVEQCRVLFLALEDSSRRLKQRLGEIGHWPENLDFCTVWPRGNVTAFEEYLDKFPDTKLIVIDTYGRWSPPSANGKAATYDEDVTNLSGLQALAVERHIAIQLVMHTRKAAAVDVIDEISGSTGISGTADTLWVLKRPRGERAGELHITGRDVAEETYAVQWDDRLYSWRLLGKAREINISREREAVLDCIRRHPQGLLTREVADEIGKSRQATLKLLKKLERDRTITVTKEGRYVTGLF